MIALLQPALVVAGATPVIFARSAAPALDADMSLDWVTFSDDGHAKPCERKPAADPCPLEAVFRIFFKIRCAHPEGDMAMCLPHKDETVAALNDGTWKVVCQRCGAPITLLRVEPIR